MEEIDLKELFNIFWSKKLLIFFIVLIFTIIGAVYVFGFKVPVYSSSTTLVLAMSGSEKEKMGENSITATDITLNSKLVPTYSELVKSKNVLREVISNLGISESEEDIRKNVSVKSVEDTEVIKITVSNENAVNASKIANEIANVFSRKINEIYHIDNIYIVDNAEVADSPSNINKIKDMLIFVLIGLVVSMIYVFVLNLFDTTVKSVEDIENAYDIPVLISIPLMDSFDEDKGGKK